MVHLAWAIQPSHDRRRLHDVNVAGRAGCSTRPVARACRTSSSTSSVGAYSPPPDDVPRAEGWATDGVRTSSYSVDKASVERVLDEDEAAYPDLAVARRRRRSGRRAVRELVAGIAAGAGTASPPLRPRHR